MAETGTRLKFKRRKKRDWQIAWDGSRCFSNNPRNCPAAGSTYWVFSSRTSFLIAPVLAMIDSMKRPKLSLTSSSFETCWSFSVTVVKREMLGNYTAVTSCA